MLRVRRRQSRPAGTSTPPDGRYPHPVSSEAVPAPKVFVPEPPRPLGIPFSLLALAVGYGLAGVGAAIAVLTANAAPYDTLTVVLSLVGLWCGFAGVPFVLSRIRGTSKMSRDFGLRIGGPADVGLGLAAGVLVYAVVELYGVVLSRFDHVDLGKGTEKLAGHGLGPGFVVFGLAVAVGAPICEELFFRGLVQPSLQRRLGGWVGLVLTAAFFGLLHVGDNPPEAAVPLAFFGVVVGVLAWRTGRLGPGIVTHMTFNGITVVALALSR